MAPSKRKIDFPDDRLPFPTRPMSPEEVFGVLRTMQLAQGRESAARWTNATTIAQAFGFLGRLPAAAVFDLADGLNEFFGTEISEEAYEAARCPAKTRTLGDLCRLIAVHAVLPRIEPRTPQSALDVVFAILSSAGAEIPAAGASSSLTPSLRKYRRVFENQIVKLGCGRVPPPVVEYPRALGRLGLVVIPLFVASCMVGLVSGILTAASLIAHDIGVWVFMWCWGTAMACMLPMLLSIWLSYALGYARPRLEGLETFSDLARAIVGDPNGSRGR
jgi:hypothetical protein